MEKFFEHYERLAKNLLPLTIFLYLVGFITLNSYLARYGIVNFDILNARYLIAGALVAIPLVCIAILAWECQKTEGNTLLKYILNIILLGTFSYAQLLFFRTGDSFEYTKLPIIWESFIYKFDPIGIVFPFRGASDLSLFLRATVSVSIILAVIGLCFFTLIVLFIKLANFIKRGKSNKSEKNAIQKVKKSFSNEFKASMMIFFGCFVLGLLIAAFLIMFKAISENTFSNVRLSFVLIFSWTFFTFMMFEIFFSMLSDAKKRAGSPQPTDIPEIFRLGLFPFIMSLLLFGQTIFPKISFSLGGGRPRSVLLKTNSQIVEDTDNKILLLDESKDYLYLVSEKPITNSAIIVSKKDVISIYIQKPKRIDPIRK